MLGGIDENTHLEAEEPEFFSVYPKLDCPHVHKLLVGENLEQIARQLNSLRNSDGTCSTGKCKVCEDSNENWLSLWNPAFYCSRYTNGHMVAQYEAESSEGIGLEYKCCALSLSDASVWCYVCDSYVHSPSLRHLTTAYGTIKFSEESVESQAASQKFDEHISKCGELALALVDADAVRDPFSTTAKEFDDTNKEEVEPTKDVASPNFSQLATPGFTRQELVDNLRGLDNEGKCVYRKVVFLTGAGISVAAGIPDFRTPEIGLYAQVAKLGLEQPELIFTLDYFKQKPETFYTVGGSLLLQEAHPIGAHFLIKQFQKLGCLHKCFTQNIDGLEMEAGIDSDLLIQAHGHMRSARCVECKSEVDMSVFHTAIRQKKVLRCEHCTEGLVKPDVTFFGEALPEKFISSFQSIKDADLVFIMGAYLFRPFHINIKPY